MQTGFSQYAYQLVCVDRTGKERDICDGPELGPSARKQFIHDAHLLNLAERSKEEMTGNRYIVEQIDARESAAMAAEMLARLMRRGGTPQTTPRL